MNWTGGTLQRTKNANKGVIQKQRAHFARARTKLQQSPNSPTTPFRPDFLRDGDCIDFGHHIDSSTSSVIYHAGSNRQHVEKGRCLPCKARRQQCKGDSHEISSYFERNRHRDEDEGGEKCPCHPSKQLTCIREAAQ